jgi:hypothetical protein
MTLQTAMLAIMIGVALILTAGIAFAIARWLDKDELPSEPDPQSEMYAAWERYCDALDDAALNGDTREYDRIKAIGWRRFSGVVS